MLERHFQRAMQHGARLLFWMAVLLVVHGIVQGVQTVIALGGSGGRERTTWLYDVRSFWFGLSNGWALLFVHTLAGLSSASLPFFGALVVDRFDRWLAGKEPRPEMERFRDRLSTFERIAQYGPRLLFGLSAAFFVLTLLLVVAWALQFAFGGEADLAQRAGRLTLGLGWLHTLSSGGLLLAAALLVDRCDRWVAATDRPTA